jgi:zona occludens toxin
LDQKVIYLRTGANGAGKTLLTLKEVREKSIAENRPVYHNGRFKIAAGGPLETWKQIEFKDWQTVPDGAIFVIDECHNEMPVRTGKDVPEPIKMLAEHRRRGFDFYLITQHPMNLDAFVRRLIGSPGWHQHLKRASGAPLVSVIEWNAVNEAPHKAGASESGQIKMVTFPKDVYGWYESTSLDTAKVKVPFQVKVMIAAVLAVPLLAYFGWQSFQKAQPHAPVPGLEAKALTPAQAQNVQANAGPKKIQTAAEYGESLAARIDGFPQTAARYDDLTKPTVAPFPAACIASASKCQCWTQQATKIPTPPGVCEQIVKSGFFMDWQAGPSTAAAPVSQSVAVGSAPSTPAPMDFKGSIPVRQPAQVHQQKI